MRANTGQVSNLELFKRLISMRSIRIPNQCGYGNSHQRRKTNKKVKLNWPNESLEDVGAGTINKDFSYDTDNKLTIKIYKLSVPLGVEQNRCHK
ncbi:MAG: hypothetical protein ACJAT7_000424 [Psychromonas sp.]|jgi:hypothetical protein